MYDRTYGNSAYTPSHFHEPKKEHRAPKAAKTLSRKILTWVIAILATLLFIAWLCLGDFRFMFWRYPSFTGFPFGTRTYIVLFQNNYELRPTGGFISTYGVLKFSHGFYAGIDFYDVYGGIDDHEYIEPPLVLSALLSDEGYQGHTFRDANYDPDFRVSKDKLIEFYQMTNPDAQVDGVIAADFTFLERLVGLYEPLEVEDYSLTQQNLFETLSAVVSDIDRHSEEDLANRKNITTPLVQKIIFKSIILPWRLFTIRDEIAQAFNEKHLLAAFTRSGIAGSFNSRNWDGALPQSDLGDFLAINEGNYGGMKADRYMTRDVQYELTVTDKLDVLGNPVVKATVSVTLSHEGGWNTPLSGPYSGYLRTMIPLGSNVEVGGTVSEDREDVEVLGEMVTLDPGQSVTYVYSYVLPEYVWNDGDYLLHLHKQPGTNNDHYRVIVHLPEGESMESDFFDVRENTGFFETNLLTDTNLMFSLVSDNGAPRIVSHELTGMNQITLIFNEALNPEHAGDPLNYEILDTNFTLPDVTDTLSVVSIRVDGSAVTITTAGMSEQFEERYEVTLHGITDTKGNFITPDPRTVTVVQRAIEAISEEVEPVVEETPEVSDNAVNE